MADRRGSQWALPSIHRSIFEFTNGSGIGGLTPELTPRWFTKEPARYEFLHTFCTFNQLIVEVFDVLMFSAHHSSVHTTLTDPKRCELFVYLAADLAVHTQKARQDGQPLFEA